MRSNGKSPKKEASHHGSPTKGSAGKRKSNAAASGSSSPDKTVLPAIAAAPKGRDRVVGRSRDMFLKILKERGEIGQIQKWWNKPVAGGGGGMLTRVIPLLEKPQNERTNEDKIVIAHELRRTKVFEQLKISPDMETALAEIASVRNYFIPGGIVVREGQPGDCFFCILEGCCVFQRQDPDNHVQEGQEHGSSKLLVIVNIVEALGIAAADATGTSDAFVVVKVGTNEQMTFTAMETLNPVWETTLTLEVPPDATEVEVQVWDHDAWGDNDFLGMASVTINHLKMKMHKFHGFSMKLESDYRYESSADEGDVNLEISGTITFHVKLTTDEALQKAEDLSAASAAADIFVSGDSFGAEEVQAGTAYQYTVMVEQPSVLLRVSRNQYMESIAPLQEMERLRKLDFLAPIMPFSEMPKEKVTEISDWFQIARYRAGENITDEGIVSDKIIFLLSGEAEVIKRVWNDEIHQKQAYKDIQNRALTSQLSEDSPSAAFMSIYGATRDPLEGVRTSSLGWITPGMTINLEETLTKHPNTYTATADTPVEVLVSGGGSLITLSGDWHAPSWDHDFQPKASSEEEGAAAAAAGGSEAAHGGAGVGGVAGAEEDSGATRVSSLEATTSKLGKLILGHQDFEPLLERAPAFPHLENLANQFSERRDWQKYKQTLVSNIIFQKRRSREANGLSREKFDFSGLLGDYRHEPFLPKILKPVAEFDARDIKKMEKKGEKYDPDVGQVISFKDRLREAASPQARVYSYHPPSYRPPSSYGSYLSETPQPQGQ